MIHLEILSFSNDLMKPKNKTTNEHSLVECLERIINETKQLMNDSLRFIPDTAHMFTNRCDTFDDFK